MGTSCTTSRNTLQRKFSRIESCTNSWINNGYFDLIQLLQECAEFKVSMYLSSQHMYALN